MERTNRKRVAVIGGGFAGLSAAYELARAGVQVTVLEAESELGGLAGAFDVGGAKLERFYHHWFTSDAHVMGLIDELGMSSRVLTSPTNTGIFYANQLFRLSTPTDVLRFKPLRLLDRVRLGLLALRARRVRDWKSLESKTAHEWLVELGGEDVYRVVWEPLLKGKFGPYAEDISAVWFWNKLKLRGGSRGKGGEERLAYFDGGFVALVDALAAKIRELGGRIDRCHRVDAIERSGKAWSLCGTFGTVTADHVIATPALPLVGEMVRGWASSDYVRELNRINYIGNVCLVLELSRPLSDTYWMNVNDPDFPFVGVIEHTNFADSDKYGGKHIAYLSKYLPHTDPLYAMEPDAYFKFAFPFLRRMFPAIEKSDVQRYHLWRARWSQPIVTKGYGSLIPKEDGPEGFHLCSMAQIYPEDRGTNYAIRAGRRTGKRIASLCV